MPKNSKKKANGTKTRRIKVDYLARVEGEGALDIQIRRGRLTDVKLKIFEPPRFFEAFLRGRHFMEAPDVTARICGICPIAYELGASYAMEDACGVSVNGPLRKLRRLIYDGEWIESHVLHIYMLHAPDFLGYEDSIQMAKDHLEHVQRGLRMKKAGNAIVALLGGREVHPVNLRVGGFYKVPPRNRMRELLEELKWGRDAAIETVKWVAGFEFLDFDADYEFVALRHPDEYAIIEGQLVSTCGIDCPISDYDHHLVEEHVEHSTALHTRAVGRGPVFLGPMARYNINFDKLPDWIQDLGRQVGLSTPCTNPFKSIIIRALETLYAFDEAIHIVEGFQIPDEPHVPIEPRAGTGYAATEAPRGICYHRYTIDDQGIIEEAKIVSPTCVNQKTIEKDLWQFVTPHIDWPDDKLKWHCEQAIRNYDPCISCSTHFLKLNVDRQ